MVGGAQGDKAGMLQTHFTLLPSQTLREVGGSGSIYWAHRWRPVLVS